MEALDRTARNQRFQPTAVVVLLFKGNLWPGELFPAWPCIGFLPTEQLCWPECESCCMLIRPSCLTGFGC